MTLLSRVFQKIFIAILWLYKVCISPYLPMACRFYPTCSVYMMEAIETHGFMSGVWLGIKRLGRCQPFGADGIDFVPEAHYCRHNKLIKVNDGQR